MPAVPLDDDPGGLFPPTRWTLVLLARKGPEQRRDALAGLLGPRWKALYVLARKKGLSREQAEDAVQSFIERIVGGDLIERLDPSRGRLRAYLRTAFAHHLTNLHVSARAQKRGSGRRAIDLDALEELVASTQASPEVLFDRAFALALFEAALTDLEREFSRGERKGPFELVRELFQFGEVRGYDELAAKYGMSQSQLKAFVHRAKRRFFQLVRARVAETVSSPSEVDPELRAVLDCLRGE
jgi:DNA-directed RNA polymerase specialized sigma24 family protein